MFCNKFNGYKYIFSESAKRDIKKLDKQITNNIFKKLDELVSGHLNLDIKVMVGTKFQQYRLRVGDYRVIFEEIKNEIIIVVICVGHRKEVYKRMVK